MSSCAERPLPNLKEYTAEEMRELGLRWYELSEAGHKDKADALALQFPLTPEIAQALKEQRGIDALIASGLNLSRAVQAYGHQWLSQR